MRVFAGQRDVHLYRLGAIFDTLNLRPGHRLLSGFNVHEIALEVPVDVQGQTRSPFRFGAYIAPAAARHCAAPVE
jgi:hypothetical protein